MAAYFLFDNVEVSDPAALAAYAKETAKLVAEHGGRRLTTGCPVARALVAPTGS